MNLRNISRRISLAPLLFCFFIPQVQAGFFGEAANNDDTSSAVANAQFITVAEITSGQHSDVDIIELKLGMSQEQVIAALKKHNKDFDITFSEFKVTPNQRKQGVDLPDHVTAINAAVGDARTAPYETVVIGFSSPPAKNTVNQIVRSERFAQDTETDTIVSALKEKYGTPTPKNGLLLWDYSAKGNKNGMCHMFPTMGNQGNFYDPVCNGMELIATVDTRQKTLRGLTTVLIDHGEIKRQILATNDYRTQLRKNAAKKN